MDDRGNRGQDDRPDRQDHFRRRRQPSGEFDDEQIQLAIQRSLQDEEDLLLEGIYDPLRAYQVDQNQNTGNQGRALQPRSHGAVLEDNTDLPAFPGVPPAAHRGSQPSDYSNRPQNYPNQPHSHGIPVMPSPDAVRRGRFLGHFRQPHQWDNNLNPYQALGYPAAQPMFPQPDVEHMNYLDESGAPQHLRGLRNLYPINANANAAENIQQSVSNTNPAAAPTGSASNFPGAGAVQIQGGPQPILRLRDPDPSNAVANAADNIQQRPSGAAAPTNPAPMTIAQRLDNGLIENVEGLTREEEDELVDWARGKGMTWDAIRRKFKFPLQESTLRVRFRTRRMDRPPRVPEFTERDDELLLEAVEVLAGRHLDNVDDYIRRLWNSAQEYIQSHGGTTTAGPVTLKKRYWFLIEQTPKIRGDLEPSKAKWDHKSYEKYHVPGQEEADFEESNEDEPTGETSPGRGGESQELNELRWNHEEYEQYDVPGLEEADFEDDPEEERSGDASARDGRAGPELMEFEWDHAEYEQYEVEDEESADFEEDKDEGDHAS